MVTKLTLATTLEKNELSITISPESWSFFPRKISKKSGKQKTKTNQRAILSCLVWLQASNKAQVTCCTKWINLDWCPVHGKTPKHSRQSSPQRVGFSGSQPSYWAPRPGKLSKPFSETTNDKRREGRISRPIFPNEILDPIEESGTEKHHSKIYPKKWIKIPCRHEWLLFIPFCLVPRWHPSNTYSAQANSQLFITAATAGTVWDRTCSGNFLIVTLLTTNMFTPFSGWKMIHFPLGPLAIFRGFSRKAWGNQDKIFQEVEG